MKYCIQKHHKENKKTDKSKDEIKTVGELLVFAFSMCALTLLIVFASLEVKSDKSEEEKSEYVALIEESELYEIFDLNLLENGEKYGGVSEKEQNSKTGKALNSSAVGK